MMLLRHTRTQGGQALVDVLRLLEAVALRQGARQPLAARQVDQVQRPCGHTTSDAGNREIVAHVR